MRRIATFFRRDLWRVDMKRQRWPRRIWFGLLRVIAHVVANYDRHLIGPRAGGLTLVTLLAIVPLLAIAFSVADAFEFRELLEDAYAQNLSDLPQGLQQAAESIFGLVERTSFRALGLVGSLVLVWSGLSLFVRVEQSLNYAWKSHVRRGLLPRITTFISLLLIVPVFAVGALFLSSALRSGSLVENLREDLPVLMQLYDAGLWLLPHLMASVAFFALYRLMPNARVSARAAGAAGLLAGFGLVTVHMAYVDFQVGVARTNAIYATLAAVPLLLVYLQLAWTVVLIGAEVGFAVQHIHQLGPEPVIERMSFATRERLAASLIAHATVRYERGAGALLLAEFAADCDVPREWVDEVVEDLASGSIVLRVGEDAVVTSRPGRQISVGDVQRTLRGNLDPGLRQRVALARPVERAIDESRPAADSFAIHFDPSADGTDPAPA